MAKRVKCRRSEMSILNSFAQGGRLRLAVRAEGYPKLSKPAPVVKFKVRECMASVLTQGSAFAGCTGRFDTPLRAYKSLSLRKAALSQMHKLPDADIVS